MLFQVCSQGAQSFIVRTSLRRPGLSQIVQFLCKKNPKHRAVVAVGDFWAEGGRAGDDKAKKRAS